MLPPSCLELEREITYGEFAAPRFLLKQTHHRTGVNKSVSRLDKLQLPSRNPVHRWLIHCDGILQRSSFVSVMDQNEGPITAEAFVLPLVNALVAKRMLSSADAVAVKAAGSVPVSPEPQGPEKNRLSEG
jgi:hypothetical protein